MTRVSEARNRVARARGPLNGLIADRMRALGIRTVKEFSTYAGVSKQSLSEIVRGRITPSGTVVKPNLDTLVKLAAALGKPAHELLYLVDPDAPGSDFIAPVEMVPVMLAGEAGAGPERHQLVSSSVPVERTFAQGRDLLAFQIVGNSMAGGRNPIYDSDVVVVDRRLAPEMNRPVVVRLQDDGYVCKRLRSGNILDSANPDYDDEEFGIIQPTRVAEIVGKVVRVIHNMDAGPDATSARSAAD